MKAKGTPWKGYNPNFPTLSFVVAQGCEKTPSAQVRCAFYYMYDKFIGLFGLMIYLSIVSFVYWFICWVIGLLIYWFIGVLGYRYIGLWVYTFIGAFCQPLLH